MCPWYGFVTQPLATDLLGQPRTKRFNPKRSSVCVFWPYNRPDSDDQAYVGQQLRRQIPTGGINADKIWYGGTAEFAKPVAGYVEITAVVYFHRRQSAVPAGIAKYDQLSQPRPYVETLQPIPGLHSADSESNLSDNEELFLNLNLDTPQKYPKDNDCNIDEIQLIKENKCTNKGNWYFCKPSLRWCAFYY